MVTPGLRSFGFGRGDGEERRLELTRFRGHWSTEAGRLQPPLQAGRGRSVYVSCVGAVEDELRLEAEDALAALPGLDVRRMFTGWGFYRNGLLFGAAWDGEFRFRTRRDGHWIYEPVNRRLLRDPSELVGAALATISTLEREPSAHPRRLQSRTRRLPTTRR